VSIIDGLQDVWPSRGGLHASNAVLYILSVLLACHYDRLPWLASLLMNIDCLLFLRVVFYLERGVQGERDGNFFFLWFFYQIVHFLFWIGKVRAEWGRNGIVDPYGRPRTDDQVRISLRRGALQDGIYEIPSSMRRDRGMASSLKWFERATRNPRSPS